MIDVCLLGTGGMMPLPRRWLSSLLIRSGRQIVLCDCGEGTQISWKYTNWGFREVGTIALSHLHADHVAGLPGVLFMIAHAGRTEDLTIFGPTGTAAAVAALRTIAPRLPYRVETVELSGGEHCELADGLLLRAQSVDHRVPCLAFRFDRPRAPRFDAEQARSLGIPMTSWSYLQRGQSVTVDGRTFQPAQVLGEQRRGLALAYVTDTRPTPELPNFVRDVDLLICEGMYGDPSHRDRAIERGHMIFQEAAELARAARARRLWLTHFSPALEKPETYLPLARAIFAETEIGQTHRTDTLTFTD